MNAGISHNLLILSVFVMAGSVFADTGFQEEETYCYPLKRTPAIIQVHGSSTLGQWDCGQNSIDGLAEINISAESLYEKIADVLKEQSVKPTKDSGWKQLESKVQVAIDANGFSCDNGRMQRDLADAIRADKYPSINYWFTQVEKVSVLVDDERGPYLELKVHGELLFGGKRKKTVHTSQLWLTENSSIEVKGHLNLEMSEFGIKPPTALLGLIRAGNNFQVSYHIKLETKEMVSTELPLGQSYSLINGLN